MVLGRLPDDDRQARRRKQPMAAFQTLLGLGTSRPPTPYRRIRGGRDMLNLLGGG